MRVKNKKLLLCILAALPLIARGEDYTVNTVTRNDWKTMDMISVGDTLAKNGGAITENSATNIKYEYKYSDGTILGTKTKYASGGDTVNAIITNRNMTAANDIRTKPTTETTMASDGTIHFIHVDDGTPIDWQDGIHVYNSNGKLVDRSETILNLDANTDFNIRTHAQYNGRYYPIYSVVKVVGEGTGSYVTKPVSTVNFLKKVNLDSRIQTVNPGNLKFYEKRVSLFFNQTNQGGESHVHFHDDLTMNTESTTDNLDIAAFWIENNGENRYRTISTRDNIDPEQGASTITFDGNVTSTITGNTNTGMELVSNTNYHGGVHVEAKEGKSFTSTIVNKSTANTNNMLQINTDTKNHGLSVFTFKGNSDFITNTSSGTTWGMYMNADSNGENRLTLAGAKNNISTTGKDYVYGIEVSASINDETGKEYSNIGKGKNLLALDHTTVTTESISTGRPWVFGIKSSAIDGENTLRLHDSHVKTASNFAARSIDVRDENKGITHIDLTGTKIDTKGSYAYGINLLSSDTVGSGESSIHWSGDNQIHTEAIANGYGIRIEKDKANTGNGTTLSSDADSTLAIRVDTEKSGTGISQIHLDPNNKTNTTFNGDVSITMRGNGQSKVAVLAKTDGEGTSDTSSNTITFNKKLTIDENPTDPALVSSGTNTTITVSGKDTTTILGNVFTANKGTVNLNLLTKDSYLIGKADHNDSGNIHMKVDNSSYWEMTDDSKISTLALSNGGEVRFGDTEVPLTLTVDSITGSNGTLHMGGNVSSGKTDLLRIKHRSEGEHGIYFRNMADSKSTGTEVLKLVESLGKEEDHTAVFSLRNESNNVPVLTDDTKPNNAKAVIEKGAYLYTLGRATDSKIVAINDKNKNNWYLFPMEEDGKGKLTPGAKASMQYNHLLYNMQLGTIETLVQRLGEIHLHKDIERSNDVWAKYVSGKYDGPEDSGYHQRYWGIKGGYDWVHPREKWIHYSGYMLGMIRSHANVYAQQGHAQMSGTEIGYYSTRLYKDSNFYVDLVGKLRRYSGQFELVNDSKETVKASNINAMSYLVSAELGRRIYIKQEEHKGVFIEPEVQLTYQRTNGYGIQVSNGLHAQVEPTHSLIGRIGIRAGVDRFNRTSFNPYLKLMYEKEFLGSGYVMFNESSRLHVSYKGHWITYGIGLSYMNKARTEQAYIELQASTRDRVRQQWQLNLGLRHTF